MKIIARQLIEEIKACKELPEAMKMLLIDFVLMMSNMEESIKAASALAFCTRFLSQSELEINHPEYFTSLLGYGEDEKLNFTFEELVKRLHPDDVCDLMKMMEFFYSNNGKTMSGYFRLRHKSGDYIWLYGSVKLNGYDTMTAKPVISGFVHALMSDNLLEEKLNLLLKEILIRKNDMLAHRLTKHELDIARCIADGYKSDELCDKFNICLSTLKATKKEMFEKTGVRNAPELVKFLFTHGLY